MAALPRSLRPGRLTGGPGAGRRFASDHGRVRPAFIFQESSATAQRRLFGGPLVPGSALRERLLPALPWPRGLRFQALHSADAATAYRLALTRDVSGPFNLAAEPVLDAQETGDLLDAKVLEVPPRVVRRGLGLAWAAHLVPAAPGLFDTVMQLPLLDAARARTELGWGPEATSREALAALLRGLRGGTDGSTPPLAAETGGPLRSHEVATGVGTRP